MRRGLEKEISERAFLESNGENPTEMEAVEELGEVKSDAGFENLSVAIDARLLTGVGK